MIKIGRWVGSILISFGLLGCSAFKKVSSNKPSLDTLSNVGYNVDRNGTLNLKKEYSDNEGYTDTIKPTLQPILIANKKHLSKRNNSAPIEKVPKFETNHQKNLRFKQNEVIEKKIVVRGGKVKVVVEDIPLPQFIDLIFAKVLNVNFTMDKDVKKLTNKITLNISSPQKKQKVFDVVKAILNQEGVQVLKENNTFFLSKTGKRTTASMSSYIGYGRTINSNIPDSKEIIQFVPYYYVNPRNSVGVLKKAGLTQLEFYYPFGNTQMLKGKAREIRRALKLIELFDRPFLEGKTSYIVKCDYMDISKFVKRIKEIFKVEGINVSASAGEGGILISEIPELNSALVITPKQEWLDMLIYWKNKLDVKSELGFQHVKLYTYKVKNRKADELALLINKLLSMHAMEGVSKQPKTVTSNSINNSLLQDSSSSSSSIKSTLGNIESNTIIADMHTNMLMMNLLPSQYMAILPFIEKLDVYPPQVMVEVTVAEVTLTDEFSLGFEYALRNNAALSATTGNILSDAVTALLSSDKGITSTYTSKNLTAIIDALAKKKLLNIVSKPKMVILNNETGSINVGQQIPVVNSESSATDLASNQSNTPSILRNISYRNTGITLNLKPIINSNGILTMDVSLTLSEAQTNNTSSIDSPLIVNRSLQTNLVMKSGDNVLLGGLISSNYSETKGGIPILKDIPLFGQIFKGNSNSKTKTELIMLIHPVIVKTPSEMLNFTNQYKLLLKAIKKL